MTSVVAALALFLGAIPKIIGLWVFGIVIAVNQIGIATTLVSTLFR